MILTITLHLYTLLARIWYRSMGVARIISKCFLCNSGICKQL